MLRVSILALAAVLALPPVYGENTPPDADEEFQADHDGALERAGRDFAQGRDLDPDGIASGLEEREMARYERKEAALRKAQPAPPQDGPLKSEAVCTDEDCSVDLGKGLSPDQVKLKKELKAHFAAIRVLKGKLETVRKVQVDPILRTGPKSEDQSKAYVDAIVSGAKDLGLGPDGQTEALNVYTGRLPPTPNSRAGQYKTQPLETEAETKRAKDQKEGFRKNSGKTLNRATGIIGGLGETGFVDSLGPANGPVMVGKASLGSPAAPGKELSGVTRLGGHDSDNEYQRTVREGSVPAMSPAGGRPKPAESKSLWGRVKDEAKDIQKTAVDYWSAGGRQSLKDSEKMGENGVEGFKKYGSELWGKTQLVMSYAIDKAPDAAVSTAKFAGRLANPLDLEARKELVVGAGHFAKEVAVGVKDSVVDAYKETKAIGDRPTTYQTLRATGHVLNAAVNVVPVGEGVALAGRAGLRSVMAASGREAVEQAVVKAGREGVSEAVAASSKTALEKAGASTAADLANAPGAYLAKSAPEQVTPGIRSLEGQVLRDGKVHTYTAQYDDYGRLLGAPEKAATAPVEVKLASNNGTAVKDVGEVVTAQGVGQVARTAAAETVTGIGTEAAAAGGSEIAGLAKHAEHGIAEKVLHHAGEEGGKEFVKHANHAASGGLEGGAHGGGSDGEDKDAHH